MGAAADGGGSVSRSAKNQPTPTTFDTRMAIKCFEAIFLVYVFFFCVFSLRFGLVFILLPAVVDEQCFLFFLICHKLLLSLSLCLPLLFASFVLNARKTLTKRRTEKKIQIQFEAHFFMKRTKNRTENVWRIIFLVFLCHKSDFCILTCRMCVWLRVWVYTRVIEWECLCLTCNLH